MYFICNFSILYTVFVEVFILQTEAVCSGLDKKNLLEINRGWP